VYPDVGLKEARSKRDAARKQLAAGIDPSAARKAEKIARADSFEAVAREWFAKHAPRWAPGHADMFIRRLERDIFPWLGSHPIRDVTAPELLACLRRIEARGAIETAHRTLQNCGRVFRYANATGRADRDPAADLRDALAPVKEKHHAALTDPHAIGELLRAIDGYRITAPSTCPSGGT
jgi:integrase